MAKAAKQVDYSNSRKIEILIQLLEQSTLYRLYPLPRTLTMFALSVRGPSGSTHKHQ